MMLEEVNIWLKDHGYIPQTDVALHDLGEKERARSLEVHSEKLAIVKLKTNSLLLTDCIALVHLFCYRCLQMWSADCRRFNSEKTNNTLVNLV
ncbi:hypothetical protein Hanom_Chr11g01044181 [Helianthus anomalus]